MHATIVHNARMRKLIKKHLHTFLSPPLFFCFSCGVSQAYTHISHVQQQRQGIVRKSKEKGKPGVVGSREVKMKGGGRKRPREHSAPFHKGGEGHRHLPQQNHVSLSWRGGAREHRGHSFLKSAAGTLRRQTTAKP